MSTARRSCLHPDGSSLLWSKSNISKAPTTILTQTNVRSKVKPVPASIKITWLETDNDFCTLVATLLTAAYHGPMIAPSICQTQYTGFEQA